MRSASFDMRPRSSEAIFQLLSLVVVNVKTSAGLLSVPARGHEVAKKDGRPVLVVAEVAVQNLGDREHGVEADEIRELERAHGVVQAEASPLVDVLGRGEPFLEREAGFVQERDEHTVDDEAGPVLGSDDRFPEKD